MAFRTHRLNPLYHIRAGFYPIVPAYAFTIHKLQGLTIPTLVVDFSNLFAPGQFYVAVSRVRRLEDLYVLGWRQKSLLYNPKCVAFECRATNP